MKIRKASTQRLLNKYNQLINDGKKDHRISHLICAIRRREEIKYTANKQFKPMKSKQISEKK